jgi:solute carrier family 25 (mitochondrial S-adenosylmethionine transporter), member 26
LKREPDFGDGLSISGRDLVMWENMVLGFVCGGFSAAVTTPLDVARTRLMTQTKTAASKRYSGVLSALIGTFREEGARALFSGVKPRVAWISLGGAIFMGSFEEYSRVMRRMAGATD